MKKIAIIILMLCSMKAKAQIITDYDVKPFKDYYDTVHVMFLVTLRAEYSTPTTLLGYIVYKNTYVPLHWEAGDMQVSSHGERNEVKRYFQDKNAPKVEECIIWSNEVL